MKLIDFPPFKDQRWPVTRTVQSCWAAMFLAAVMVASCPLTTQAQPNNYNPSDEEVLTRGPVHEAFAGVVNYNPEAGVVVNRTPPDPIEELPPDEKPEGDNVTWIPGYWAWDDERDNFLWVSGTWRALPPGREWVAGYWSQSGRGHQWISGYWGDTRVRTATYLPPPPQTIEYGPSVAAPSPDYTWTPGCWVWYETRYAWRPGYWVRGRPDWNWVPACYTWTPRGYLFVDGYWDYPVERRGVLFAPVYFGGGFYARPHYYHYSPRIVINIGVFSDHLFLRPSYCHYYFGDYYGPTYVRGGFYASFSFHTSFRGYDPIYSHHRWEHRDDRDWERRVERDYQHRRDNDNDRPPRTWAEQSRSRPGPNTTVSSRTLMASPIEQVSKRTDSPMRFQTVSRTERDQLSKRGQEVQKSRDERRTIEDSRDRNVGSQTPGRNAEPSKVTLPKSPIASKSSGVFSRGPSAPKTQTPPKPDFKVQPKAEPPSRAVVPDRPGQPDRSQPERNQPDRTPPGLDRNQPGRTPPAVERSQPDRTSPGIERSQPDRTPPGLERNQPDRTPPGLDRSRPEQKRIEPVRPGVPEPRRSTPAPSRPQPEKKSPGRSEPSPRISELESPNKARLESQQREAEAAARAKEAERANEAAKARETQAESQRRANEAASRARDNEKVQAEAQRESQRRASEAAAKAQAESRSRPQEVEKPAPSVQKRESQPVAKGRPEPASKSKGKSAPRPSPAPKEEPRDERK